MEGWAKGGNHHTPITTNNFWIPSLKTLESPSVLKKWMYQIQNQNQLQNQNQNHFYFLILNSKFNANQPIPLGIWNKPFCSWAIDHNRALQKRQCNRNCGRLAQWTFVVDKYYGWIDLGIILKQCSAKISTKTKSFSGVGTLDSCGQHRVNTVLSS